MHGMAILSEGERVLGPIQDGGVVHRDSSFCPPPKPRGPAVDIIRIDCDESKKTVVAGGPATLLKRIAEVAISAQRR